MQDIKIGYISLLDLSDKEFETLLDYFEFKKKCPAVRYFASLIGKEAFLEMLDLFSSDAIKFPNRGETIKILNYVSIYHYLKERNFTEDAYQRAKSLYKRKIESLHFIVDTMENLNLDIEEVDEEDEQQ
jgi:hypothetical protein